MELLDCMKKREFVIHEDDVPWKTVGDGLRIKELLCEKTYGKSEFYLGVAELEVGKDIPVHKSNLACCTFLLEGEIWARLGRQRFQLTNEASNYFPIGVPHAYEASGKKGLRFLFCYATDNATGENLKWEPVSETEARAYYQANCPSNLMSPGSPSTGYRWAVAGDMDPYILVEAAQGQRSLSFQAFFDEVQGCKEMWWGRTYLKPNCRYTPHYHEQPEIFYFLSGHGTMYAGANVYKVSPGSLVYAPKNCLHGMVNDGPDPLCAIYCCNIETTDTAYVRYEVADVPLIVPEDRNDLMLSKF